MPKGYPDDDFSWEVEEADPDLPIKAEYGGRVEVKGIPLGSERKFVTKFLLFFICGIVSFGLIWGAYSGDYIPLDKTSEMTTFILGCLLGRYYNRAR